MRNPDRRTLLLGGAAGGLAATASASAAGVARQAPAIGGNAPDVVVVGAGAFGGWAALELRERGANVTLVDLYGPGNPRASSGDENRLLRASYGDREVYTRWAAEAFDLWHERQSQFGRRLIYPNGALRVLSSGALAAQRPIFDRLGLPYEILTPAEVHARWPQIRYDDAEHIIHETRAGAVKARESMIAVAENFERLGGRIRIGRAEISPRSGRSASLRVDGQPLPAGQIVLAAGPWLPRLLPSLLGDRIRTPRREIFYIGSPPGDHRYRWENLPNLADPLAYTASDTDYGVKIAARLPDTAMDPDQGDRMPTSFLGAQVRDYVARRMPGLIGQPIVAARVCQTEYTDNSHFLIDRHPDHDNVLIAGGGSGHAFKMGPVLGRYIAARVLEDSSREQHLDDLFALGSHGPAQAG